LQTNNCSGGELGDEDRGSAPSSTSSRLPVQCTTSFLCDSCPQTTTALKLRLLPHRVVFSLVCKSQRKDARMSCSRRWPALPNHATAPRSASHSPRCRRRKHVDGALRVSVVREPHHRLPVLARRHSSAGVRLPGFRGRVRQGQRITRSWISSTRTAPSYIYALYMLMLEHVSSVVTDQAFCSGHHANDSRQSSQYCPVHRAPRKFPSADE